MTSTESKFPHSRTLAFWIGAIFLLGYWLFGYDGITFSDDVYYLLAGESFWQGNMEVNSYHFSTRWGAYVPGGLMGILLGFEPHRISLISLLAYLGALGLLLRLLPKESNPWVLVIWTCTQVYFLHFLTKVYPDSLLVFWTVLVPFSAVFRDKMPFWAAFGIISGLFFGFLTKETIVFLAPLPVLLFFLDWKRGKPNFRFYTWLVGFGLLFGAIYLGYFYIRFGDPLYRVSSINAGHYISEFTYADKGIWSILRRISYLPILTFVERGYWLWVILAIPGFWMAWKEKNTPGLEFSLAAICLMLGFWFMSSTLEFYNPIYLNPRHLIILVPILGFLIASGWKEGQENPKLKRLIYTLILLGVAISLIQQDWKMAGFQFVAGGVFYGIKGKHQTWILGILLLIPSLLAISYQKNLKQYDSLLQTLETISSETENQSLILTNNFLDFSKKVLLFENPESQELLFPIEKLDSLKSNPPKEIRVLLYDYYRHAYPKEQVDVTALEKWLEMEYAPISDIRKDLVWIRTFRRKDPQ